MYVHDPFELASFLLMFYATGIGVYIALRAIRVGLPYILLSILLSLLTLFHGLHHLTAYLGYLMLEQTFELCASVSALVLGIAYAYVWKRP
jgi:cytochrome c biogenesis protein CcdA